MIAILNHHRKTVENDAEKLWRRSNLMSRIHPKVGEIREPLMIVQGVSRVAYDELVGKNAENSH